MLRCLLQNFMLFHLKHLSKSWNDRYTVHDTVSLKISIESKIYIFIKLIFISSSFSQILQNVEYEILKDWFEMLTSNDACHLDLISTFDFLFSLFNQKYILFQSIFEQNLRHVLNESKLVIDLKNNP